MKTRDPMKGNYNSLTEVSNITSKFLTLWGYSVALVTPCQEIFEGLAKTLDFSLVTEVDDDLKNLLILKSQEFSEHESVACESRHPIKYANMSLLHGDVENVMDHKGPSELNLIVEVDQLPQSRQVSCIVRYSSDKELKNLPFKEVISVIKKIRDHGSLIF